MTPVQSVKPDTVLSEAAQWWTMRQAAGRSRADEAAFQDWLAQDTTHRAAYEEIEAVWIRASALGAVRNSLLTAESPVNLSHARNRTGLTRRSYSQIAVTMAACLTLVIGGGFIAQQMTAPEFITPTGEVHSFTLTDGSRITLDGSSAVDIAFDGQERRIVLRRGAVYVVAAPKNAQEPRAFVVQAGNGKAQALGTQFAVERAGAQVRVSVTEHRVAIKAGQEQQIIEAGQSLRYDSEGRMEKVQPLMDGQAAGWREGRVIFDRVPLEEVVAQLNRHRETPVIIVGSDLARRQVSGIFDLKDQAGALDTISGSLRLRQTRTPWAQFVTAEAGK